jgi:hypothetical protein
MEFSFSFYVTYSIQLIPFGSFLQLCPHRNVMLLTIVLSVSLETSPVTRPILEQVLASPVPGFDHIVWTYNMRRLAVLVGKFCCL